jgi:hypothetical protein
MANGSTRRSWELGLMKPKKDVQRSPMATKRVGDQQFGLEARAGAQS